MPIAVFVLGVTPPPQVPCRSVKPPKNKYDQADFEDNVNTHGPLLGFEISF